MPQNANASILSASLANRLSFIKDWGSSSGLGPEQKALQAYLSYKALKQKKRARMNEELGVTNVDHIEKNINQSFRAQAANKLKKLAAFKRLRESR